MSKIQDILNSMVSEINNRLKEYTIPESIYTLNVRKELKIQGSALRINSSPDKFVVCEADTNFGSQTYRFKVINTALYCYDGSGYIFTFSEDKILKDSQSIINGIVEELAQACTDLRVYLEQLCKLKYEFKFLVFNENFTIRLSNGTVLQATKEELPILIEESKLIFDKLNAPTVLSGLTLIKLKGKKYIIFYDSLIRDYSIFSEDGKSVAGNIRQTILAKVKLGEL